MPNSFQRITNEIEAGTREIQKLIEELRKKSPLMMTFPELEEESDPEPEEEDSEPDQ